MSINSVMLIGYVGRDPEVRQFESGNTVANVSLAVNRRKSSNETDWFNLELWGKQAELVSEYVRKGSLLGIVGSLKIDSWTDRNSREQRSKPVIRVVQLQLLGSRRDSELNPYNTSSANIEEVPF
uniref:Single-stranded DNA-binding protein n=1 Tax=Paulinella micropora TaxID=1928728 RepID=A0A385I0J3_9EUKA|nr:single-strand DNA-binding protein [Paulinella micropora]AXY63395.1 single-strand DNA-binding protein [Paulinella micropora]